MSTEAEAPSGNGASGGGSDNPSGQGAVNPKDLERIVNEAVSKALGARLKRLDLDNLDERIAKGVDAHLTKIAESIQATPKPASDPAAGERQTLKSLEQKFGQEIAALKKRVEDEQAARRAAEEQAIDARVRSVVEAKFAGAFGPESPLVGTLMDSLYDVKKRFARAEDGSIQVRFKGEYGDETVALDEGFKRLLDTELKHLVPAKTAQLPSATFQPTRGTPHAPSPQGGGAVNGIFMEFARAFQQESPELAARLQQQATAPKK
ncbi:MAG TPA: hypothetical protein VJ891_09640 [Casimicrobiaceae bacterium]|nr:hypothetical protein [Casimicrobiaceae bacterium]